MVSQTEEMVVVGVMIMVTVEVGNIPSVELVILLTLMEMMIWVL